MTATVKFIQPRDAQLFAIIANMAQSGKVWHEWHDLKLPKHILERAQRLGFVEMWPRVDKRKYAARLTPAGEAMAPLVLSILQLSETGGGEDDLSSTHS